MWNVGGNLNLESELVKPCSALSHYGNKNTEVSVWEFYLYWLQVVMWYSSRFCTSVAEEVTLLEIVLGSNIVLTSSA